MAPPAFHCDHFCLTYKNNFFLNQGHLKADDFLNVCQEIIDTMSETNYCAEMFIGKLTLSRAYIAFTMTLLFMTSAVSNLVIKYYPEFIIVMYINTRFNSV